MFEKVKNLRPKHIALLICPLLLFGGLGSIGPIYLYESRRISNTFLDGMTPLTCTVLDTSIVHGSKLTHVQIEDNHFVDHREDSYAAVKFQYELTVDNVTKTLIDTDLLYKDEDEKSGLFELDLNENYYEGSVHECFLEEETNSVYMFAPRYDTLYEYEVGFGLTTSLTAMAIFLTFMYCVCYKECVWDSLD